MNNEDKQHIMSQHKETYVVSVSGLSDITVHSEEEVWEAIGQGAVGALYEVMSPSGHDVIKFVPF